MTAAIRAAVLRMPGRVEVADVPRPAIAEPTDILVRVEKAAICGTDLHPYEGRLFEAHEATKIVLDPRS